LTVPISALAPALEILLTVIVWKSAVPLMETDN